jgi:signal transduction histidine kinase
MSRATALVVDDNRELAENLCEILDSLNEVRCIVAESGRRALEACDEHGEGLDVAFVDLRLPDADGIALLPEMKARCPFAQVIIITGNASIETAAAAVGEGAFAYVLKPFRGDALVRTATQALAQAQLVREREQLRRELEQSERRHREVVEAIPAFVAGLDSSGNILLWNRRLEEVTGLSREEMLGRPGADLMAAGDRTLALKNGGHRMVRWRRAEVGASGEEPVVYAIGIDVTDEREMLRRTLRAERLAAVGTLATGLAHEVRNPLNSALLQLEVLKRRLDRGETSPEKLSLTSNLVQAEIRRLERLVNDFLGFAQAKSLELKSVSLNELVRSVVEQMKPEASAVSVEVSAELDPAVGHVDAEPQQMRQVLLNLMKNAIEAMADGGRLVVRTLASDIEGYVRVVVEDSGPGLVVDAPIFDAFYTTKETGTGLGLAIVHRIVSEHGGTIGVDSEPGRTTFTVRLPQPSRNVAT